jgi:hypothetical protein
MKVSGKPTTALVFPLASEVDARPGEVETVALSAPFRLGVRSSFAVRCLDSYPKSPKRVR